ncbi:DUF3231 family protein [Neobacillus citreus]|uniref:DUF3231 family protein n=1 Tax=Neobacillus citreus TaxID=2833578 RepID=A0A942TAD5_9BACI|nr:DUF3231 family protein [Neobacillus citreus]MCH6265136.1 DUF3231 family protein [Neobacillus citreus]
MNKNVIKLTSSEISSLWSSYINIGVANCLSTHFEETCNDPEILALLEECQHCAKKHLKLIEDLFNAEKIAIPEGFKVEKHVIPRAPKLFSDMFYIHSILHIAMFGITSHTAGMILAAREDVRILFKGLFDDVSYLYNKVVNCMQEKGIFVRMPYMNYPTKIDFVNKESFLTGWFGRRRPLLGIEVTHLMVNAIQNEVGRAICAGFSQVAQDQEVREYFLRGKHVCKHILSSIHDVLIESDVPAAMSWDTSVTDSTVAPFSDQLMIYIVGILSNLGIAAYGTALSATMRRDISAMYTGFIAKTGTFGEDGLNLMIERRWMEQPPQFEDHDKLAKKE